MSSIDDIMDGTGDLFIGLASPVGVMVLGRRSPKRRPDFAALTG